MIMANIHDVAKKAGVSVTTVSRALNNHPYVTEQTKNKIYKAMKDLNYYPNSVARQLRHSKSKMIGVIVSYITNPFFAALTHAVERKALEHGYHLIVMQTMGDPQLEDFYVNMINSKLLDGLIITNLERATPSILQLIDEGKIILCNRFIGNQELPIITIQEEEASYEGTSYLINKGHRSIAFCTGNVYRENDNRFKGFYRALKEHNIPFNEENYFEHVLGVDGGRQFIRTITNEDRPMPTAVFSNGDQVAAGMISEARKYNLSIPKDLSILGFDDQPISALTNPEITTIRQPTAEMGTLATELLINNLEGNTSSSNHLLKASLIERESVTEV